MEAYRQQPKRGATLINSKKTSNFPENSHLYLGFADLCYIMQRPQRRGHSISFRRRGCMRGSRLTNCVQPRTLSAIVVNEHNSISFPCRPRSFVFTCSDNRPGGSLF